MSTTRKHNLWAVYVGQTTPVVIGGITRQSINIGTELVSEATSGEPYARFQHVRARKPAASFATLNVGVALGVVPPLGLNVNDTTVPTELKLYAQKQADGGTRETGALHRSYAISKGFLAPRRLSCAFGGNADLGLDVLVLHDGSTNNPIIEADTVSLPAGIADAERFTLGPVTLESIALPQIRSLEIDFGLTLDMEGSDADIYPTMATIKSINPRITLRGIDIEWLKAAAIPFLGKVATHANTKIFLRKRTQDGASFVADATAQHLKFTAAGFVHVEQAFGASGQELAEVNLVMETKFDGTNNPLVYAANVAIA